MEHAANARELAAQLRLHHAGHEWRGNCPICGYADAFVLTEGKYGAAIGWCASCQNRDAIAAMLGGGRRNGGPAPKPPPRAADDVRKRVERAEKLWLGRLALLNSVAAVYLEVRGIAHLVACVDLGYHPSCPHPTSSFEHPVRLPALLGAVRDMNGKFVGIHRTFLRRDGSGKADIEPAKASLGPVRGGAVRLTPLEDVLAAGAVVIGEGIESSASAGQLLGLPAWAAISAGNMARGLVLPTGVRKVIIAADRDAAGIDAAEWAKARLRREGREVEVAVPQEGVGDFNDLLVARRERPA
jgi:phage/plasmid primase-like uncharacterized protein